jgi:hypothetical protein
MENPQALSNQPDSGPVGGDEPLSFDEGVGELEGLLDPSQDEDQSKATEPTTKEDSLENDNEEVEASEGEEDTDEEVDEEAEESPDEEESDPEAITFDDDLAVELDGEETTLGAIVADRVQKRVSDFQADYTRKTQQIAEERKVIDSQAERLMSTAEQVKQQRETFLNYQAMFAPEPPDISMVETDPIGYQQQKAYYDQWNQEYSGFVAETQRMNQQAQQEQAAKQQEYLSLQQQRLGEVMPELATREGLESFKQELVKDFVPHYGYTVDDLNNIKDYRFAKLAKDAMAYRKLQEGAPEAKKKLQGKPKMLKGKARASGKSKKITAHKAKQDRLQKLGDIESAIDVLVDFVD